MAKIQYKLVGQLLLTSTLPLIILAVMTVVFLGKMSEQETTRRLESGLSASVSVLDVVSNNLKYKLRDQNRRIFTLLYEDQIDLLKNEYVKVVRDNEFDFFVITDTFGKVLVSISNPSFEGRNIASDPHVRKALFRGQPTVSIEVLEEEALSQLGLLEKSGIPGIEHPRGMIIQSTFPVINNNEIIVGTMSTGYLLNNNNKLIIDRITENIGMVSSVFMDDIRICSSVPSQGKEYAVGSRIDPRKAFIMLREGDEYLGRIKVIKEWYLAGYAPLRNSQKKIIGVLGIGIPETAVYKLRNRLIMIFMTAVICSIVLSFIIGFWMGGGIVNSVTKLMKGIESVIKGDYGSRITIQSRDEIEEVGESFNKMSFRLLEAKRQLGETHKQLVQYEKMAAIGRMAAVLSHELRNVFAGIEVSIYYLKAKLSKDSSGLLNKILEIEKSIKYAHSLLSNISLFVTARKITPSQTDINGILEETLRSALLQDMIKNSKISLEMNLDGAIPAVMADGIQMKEVFSNLCMNAVQAMPHGGILAVSTRKNDSMLEIRVQDNGSGIPEETLKNLFTPFFTTKSKGLGLGLFIAKEIVELHKGKIEVTTEVDKGTRINVLLPLAPPLQAG